MKKRRGGKSLSGAEKRKRNAHLKSCQPSSAKSGRAISPQTGLFEWIGGVEAKLIKTQMAARVKLLESEIKTQGLHIQSADCPVRLGQETRSVDVCLWSKHLCCNALIEAKWTRGALHAATLRALQSERAEGIWQRPRKKVNAAAIGVLVVNASSWYCRLVCVSERPFQWNSLARSVRRRREEVVAVRVVHRKGRPTYI